MTKTKSNPLVSVLVVTYNSAAYVLETLESIKRQTYKNIELIISDDCGHDDTVRICRQWVQENSWRFVKAQVITSERNTGISGNCNRALNVASGEWLKFIGGDDIILDDAIEQYVAFAAERDDCNILFGRVLLMKGNTLSEDDIKPIYSLSQEKQHMRVLIGSGLPSAADFLRASALRELGGYDERYQFLEDVPLWIKASEKGFYIYYMDRFTIKYRIHSGGISRANSDRYFNLKFYFDSRAVAINEILPRMLKRGMYFDVLNVINGLIVRGAIVKLGNKNNILSKLLNLLIIKDTYRRLKSIAIRSL